MLLNNEINKVQCLLKIPVSGLEFVGNNTVQVYSGGHNIGGIPCYSVSGIYHYEASENVVNWLNWRLVYKDHENIIDELIFQNLGRADICCSAQNFRQVRASEYDAKQDILVQQIGLYEVAFESGDWSIQKIVRRV